jgi:hypothetical protein
MKNGQEWIIENLFQKNKFSMYMMINCTAYKKFTVINK